MANKPLSVKVLNFIAWLNVIAGVVLIAIALAAAAVPPGDGGVRDFINGGIEGLGYDPASFGSHEAGYVIGSISATLIPVGILLFALRSKRLRVSRVSALLWLLLGAAGGRPILPLIAAVLVFLPSVKQFFNASEEIDAGPSEDAEAR